MSVTLVCSGTVTQNTEGAAICSTGWSVQPTVVPFDLAQIDPAVATAMFGSGFSLLIIPWATAWGLSQLFKLIEGK